MTDGPYQPNQGVAIPVTAIDDPPEGRKVIPLSLTLTPTNYAQSNYFTINPQQNVTQIRTLFVDNTNNLQVLMVTHGEANATTSVPAGGTAIIPTTSYSTNYNYSFSTANAPATNIKINFQLFNYEIPPATSGTTILTQNIANPITSLQNPFHNPNGLVNQRGGGTSINASFTLTSTPTYTLDGWIASIAGNANAAQAGAQGHFQLRGVGGSSIGTVTRRIIGQDTTALIPWSLINAGKKPQMILQFKVRNNTNASFTPSITFFYPTSQNNFASLTQDITYFGQPVPVNPNNYTQIAISLPFNGNPNFGLEVRIGALAIIGAATIDIFDIDMYIDTNSITTGQVPLAILNAARIPTFEDDLERCTFFYDKSCAYGIVSGTAPGSGGGNIGISSSSSTNVGKNERFSRPMFKIPSITVYDNTGAINKVSYYTSGWNNGASLAVLSAISEKNFYWAYGGTAVIEVNFDYFASAEP